MDNKYNEYYNTLLDSIVEILQKGYEKELEIVHFYAFDRPQIKTLLSNADRELDEYDYEQAIERVVAFEEEYDGGVCTDIEDSESLLDTLLYTIFWDIMDDLPNNISKFEVCNNEVNKDIIIALKQLKK